MESNGSSGAPRGSVQSRLVAPLLLFVAAGVLRSLSLPRVYDGRGGVYFFGNDAYYHARRILHAIQNFPEFLRRDPYQNYPFGGEPIWTPTFDVLAALAARWLVGDGDIEAVERFLIWIPPVLGATTVVLLYFLARRFVGTPAALAAAALLALLPAHSWYSQLAFVDHHAATALVTTLLIAAGMVFVAAEPCGNAARRTRSVRAGLLGLAMAAALAVWPGCLLQVGALEATLALWLLASRGGEAAAGRALRAAWVNVVAALAIAPLALGNQWTLWGPVSPLVLSNFQPLFLATSALGFFVLAGIWRAVPSRSVVERALHMALAAAFCVGLLTLLLPELWQGLAQSWAWFVKADRFQVQVKESWPLLASGFDEAFATFSRAILLFPLLVVGLGWRARHRRDRDALWVLLFFAVVLGVATLVQARFMNSFSVAYAFVVGWAIAEMAGLARAQLRGRWIAGATVTAGAGALVVWMAAPLDTGLRDGLADLGRWHRGEPIQGGYFPRVQQLRENTANWLRVHSPNTSGWLDADARPEYGVLAPWSMGHVIKYVARRPVVQDNFGDDVGPKNWAAARAYYGAGDEDAALERLLREGRNVRYVIVQGPRGPFEQVPEGRHMMARLQNQRGGGGNLTRQDRSDWVPALSRHRLVFESVPLSGRSGERPSLYKIFEIVPGARIAGRAPPGARVTARLVIRPRQAQAFEVTFQTQADSKGRYALRLPYANAPQSPDVATDKTWRFEAPGQRKDVAVTEAMVRSTQTIAGPDLRADAN